MFCIPMYEGVYLCFKDYAKVFYKLGHKDVFELLGKYDLFENDIRII